MRNPEATEEAVVPAAAARLQIAVVWLLLATEPLQSAQPAAPGTKVARESGCGAAAAHRVFVLARALQGPFGFYRRCEAREPKGLSSWGRR
jgi:hypothetical protein